MHGIDQPFIGEADQITALHLHELADFSQRHVGGLIDVVQWNIDEAGGNAGNQLLKAQQLIQFPGAFGHQPCQFVAMAGQLVSICCVLPDGG
jgi:hypothetical protein